MILDEVLQEEEIIYNEDSMVDMFVEGFLYALEMQENGEKASSMEDLSDKLSEAANIAISELNVIDTRRKDGKGILTRALVKTKQLSDDHKDKYYELNHKAGHGSGTSKIKDTLKSKAEYHNNMSKTYQNLHSNIKQKINEKLINGKA